MKINQIKVTVKELAKNYKDDGDGGVFGYDGRLTIRPAYQREFIYKDKQREAVIDSVLKGFPLNVMYWSKTGEDTYEVLDGQQRTISLAQYVNGDFSVNIDGNPLYFMNLQATYPEKAHKFLDYELMIYVCEGSEEEKLEWFRIINIAGEKLTNQELLNATFTGPWLSDAKTYFSKTTCVAGKMSEGYIKGNPIRQEYLEKVLSWISDRDGLDSGQKYMAIHQHDADAVDLWQYFQTVINWAKVLFPEPMKGITDVQDWGRLYNKYHDRPYNSNELAADVKKLKMDEDVQKHAGIIPYVLSDRTPHDEKYLSIRFFPEAMRKRVYEKQGHKCPFCLANGIDKEYAFEEMQGDHIIPWSQGGKTVEDNLQMLCQRCNNDKGGR